MTSSFLSYLLKRRYDEYKTHYPRDPSEIWVTDLTRCQHKRELELEMPEVALAGVLNPKFILGDLIHDAVLHLIDLWHVTSGPHGKIRFDIQQRLSTSLENVGRPETLTGRIDGLFRERETDIPTELVEVKYVSGWGPEMPWTHHRLQCELYCYLAAVNDYTLIYVSPEGLRVYLGHIKSPIETLENLLKTWSSPMWPEWECRYCDYKPWCRVERPPAK